MRVNNIVVNPNAIVVRTKCFIGLHLPVWIAVIAMICGPSAGSFAASFQGVGDVAGGPFLSFVLGVSGDGSTTVGWSVHGPGRLTPFRWTESGGIEDLGDISSRAGQAVATSFDASVIGGQYNALAAIWNGESGPAQISPAGVNQAAVRGVSGDGSTAVGRQVPDGESENYVFRWTGEEGAYSLGIEGLGTDVSFDGSVIVGYGLIDHATPEAFRWTEQDGAVGLGDLVTSRFRESRAFAVTPDGSSIVGYARTDSGRSQAFVWTEASGMQDLSVIGPVSPGSSWAQDISANGTTIVGNAVFHGRDEAFIWTELTGMVPLAEWLIEEHDLNDQLVGWHLADVEGISDDGLTLAGNGTNPNGFQEGWVVKLNPVPEPQSIALVMLASLASIGRKGKRRLF